MAARDSLANCCLEAGDAGRATQAFQQATKASTAPHGDDDQCGRRECGEGSGIVARDFPPACDDSRLLSDQGKTTAELRGSSNSPMARSMANSALVLAGGNTTMRQWAAGSAPPTENDGILTAMDITEMPLDRTELVTLSACDDQRVASGEEPGGALSSTQAESLQRLRKSGGL